MSKQDDKRTKVFTDLYTAVSKATAETKNAKGEAQKTIFKGFVKDLFENVPTLTVTKFLWAVSRGHKGLALKTPLFKVTYHGKQGYEIERLHSGFVSNETGKKITGIDLVPYIIEAASLYKTNPRKQKIAEAPIVEAPAVPEQPVEQPAVEATIEQPVPEWMNVPAPEGPLEDVEGPDLTRLTDGQLNMLKWHIATEENRRRIEAKKAELFKVFSEMAKDEGFNIEDIVGMI